jgi:glutamyl-tRNA synthetase
MAQTVRVRFAPSPTGPLHIGGVRTALFNYLFAKKHQGDFVLRIEDTDRNRYVEGAEEYIIESLKWLGMDFDEGPGKGGPYGPYRQSERAELYQTYVQQLLDSGKAYYAFDTPESLDLLRKEAESTGHTFIYNWSTREDLQNSLTLDSSEVDQLIKSGAPHVVRFSTPIHEQYAFNDLVRGEVAVDTRLLDDKILFKSDGMPTYHLANVVDDHLMRISHVIRGEEWLPSLALHNLLYEAFGWKAPYFAHLPLIMKPQGKGKLSKRDGEKMGFPVFPLEWRSADGNRSSGYRESGYLPGAVVNMLAMLGWNPGTENEIFDLSELVEAFDLKRVNKGGAKFDPDKAKWFQHHYLQNQSDEELAATFSQQLSDKGLSYDGDLVGLVALLKERLTFVADLWEEAGFIFSAPENYDEKAAKKAFKEETPRILTDLKERLKLVEPFDSATLTAQIKPWIADSGVGFGKVMMPFRLAMVGEMKGPDVFDIAALLGKEECLRRLEKAVASMDQK